MDRNTPYHKVPLSVRSFRNEMNESVLEWGWIYYNNGWVSIPKEIMPGLFEVVISEACYQAVTYRLDDDDVYEAFCSCGAERHRHCRHVAALMFKLEEISRSDENNDTLYGKVV